MLLILSKSSGVGGDFYWTRTELDCKCFWWEEKAEMERMLCFATAAY